MHAALHAASDDAPPKASPSSSTARSGKRSSRGGGGQQHRSPAAARPPSYSLRSSPSSSPAKAEHEGKPPEGKREGKQVPAQQEADAAGWPTLLSTNEERNVQFYARLGFRVIEGVEGVKPGRLVEMEGEQYQVWVMLRRPQPQRPSRPA